MKQQTLPFKLLQEKSFANFFSGANESIIRSLKTLNNQSAIYLWGKPSTGCSHLLQAICLDWQQQGRYALYIDLKQNISLNTLLNGALEGVGLLALDHLETIIGKKIEEELLFHLFNRALQTPFALLCGAKVIPDLLGCKLADLTSRLNSMLIFQVKELSDDEIKQALQKHAEQRGFLLSNEVAQYLINHYPRDLNQLLELLDELDKVSLQTHKRLTIPLLKKWQADTSSPSS